MDSSHIVPEDYKAFSNDEIIHFRTREETEEQLINLLKKQGYELIEIKDEVQFKNNLRVQLEKLNSSGKDKEFRFTDGEWEWFFQEYLERKTIEENSETIQKDYVKSLKRDDESFEDIWLINKKNIYKNYLQAFKPSLERKDLVLLVNGLPLVFLEIKESWERLETQFRNLERYDRYEYLSSYFKLFRFVQLFVLSNYSETKYFSNTSNLAWVKRESGSDSNNANFRLTSYWTDSKNQRIESLLDFVEHFLNRVVLLNILTKYCVFTTEKKLIVMRPYQIDAVESMVRKAGESIARKWEGQPESRGYIWHATGSGKTLTAFKARELISQIEEISKVLFIVDRKVLDSQTRREFQKFGDDNDDVIRHTRELIWKLESPSCKKITTTFQKLSKACNREDFSNLPVLKERVVLIFDECHRSQGGSEMGNMRRMVEDKFKKSLIFGVSGTPIFDKDQDEKKANKGTNRYFTNRLSTYTLLDALNDGNVLAWRYDEAGYKKIKEDESKAKTTFSEIQRKRKVVDWILENFDIKTKGFSFKKHFNSIFATSSIKELLEYYEIFKEKNDGRLAISAIFSITHDDEGGGDDENRMALTKIIQDYNQTFRTNFDLSFDSRSGYENWREDLTRRLREVKLDLLIVVDMFLTGFDSAALNTLWIDKKIKETHDLIQIFSRTNRVHSELKDCGNIVSFVALKDKMDEALEVYVGKDHVDEAQTLVFEADFVKQYAEGKKVIEEFMQDYPNEHININEIAEEKLEDFVKRYNLVLKVHKKLSCYSEYRGKELLTEEQKQDYNSKYLDYRDEIKKARDLENKKEGGEEAPSPEIDNYAFELIKSEDVDIHYILKLIDAGEDKEVILKKLSSHTKMRKSAAIFGNFIDKVRSSEQKRAAEQTWPVYIEEEKDRALDKVIAENKLKVEERANIKEVLDRGDKDKIFFGMWMKDILPPMSYFNKDNYALTVKAQTALSNLMDQWEQYRL